MSTSSGPSTPSSSESTPPDDASSARPDAAEASSSSTASVGWGRGTAFETVLIAGGVVLLLLLLYEMHLPPQDDRFLNPPLVALAGVVLLWPLRRQKTVRALLLSGGLLLFLWAMNKISGILIPFAAVYLLAYLLNPLVRGLRLLYRVPRWLSSLFVSSVVVGSVALFILILAPSVADQVDTLSTRMVQSIGALQAWLSTSAVLDTLETIGFVEKQEVLQQLQDLAREQAGRLPEAAQNLVSSLGSVLGAVTLVALVPVLLFYTLKDYPDIQAALIDLFPTAGGRRDYVVKAGSIVGQYLRGQLLISTIATFNVSVLLFLFDVPFWLLIGLLSGLLNFIPQLGALITLFVGGLVALVFAGWIKALIVVAVLIGQSLLEQSVLTPNILSYQVGIHPLLILFSLLAFGVFFGILGLLIAVPLTAILVTAYRAYREELILELSDYSAETDSAAAGPLSPSPSD